MTSQRLLAGQAHKAGDQINRFLPMTEQQEWQNRPLKKFYTFLFVDCLYVNIRKDFQTKSCAVYVILGYDIGGMKDVLGLWIGETEGKHYWMQIFDTVAERVNILRMIIRV